jgi:hypothetical protein
MTCVVPVVAKSEWEIRRTFPKMLHEQNPGKAINPAFGKENSIDEIHLAGENPDGKCPICSKAAPSGSE